MSSRLQQYLIVMRPANEKIKAIHNSGDNPFRMPLQFNNVDMALGWTDPDLADDDIERLIGFEVPSEKFDAWPVFSVRTSKPSVAFLPVVFFSEKTPAVDWLVGYPLSITYKEVG